MLFVKNENIKHEKLISIIYYLRAVIINLIEENW